MLFIGYQSAFNNGILLCFGLDKATVVTQHEIQLPISYNRLPYCILITCQRGGNATISSGNPFADYGTISTIKIGSNSSEGMWLFWFTIGI
jgi:hypothetical protein